MEQYTKTELQQSREQIRSLLTKCQKSLTQLEQKGNPNSRTTLLKNRIQALEIALTLIDEQL
ncbi:MAG: hypothetical protein L0L63_10220 [Staphylococcus equorum]|uniref:hypothetical protein n=1 Tax=Staphylococcus TaxID=1279 RepID=UPI0008699263|nr:hypothetical protein [Staphylococcus equorum]MDG0822885.1 hypothetical protein [Staphylococcus equorum]MDG0836615.1 hypothetical protein [Staphylococcus equorum]MDK9871207.1 hypothetical protein [Staphylococcus equorum]MDK9877748.1 hypothetical protein [Staphylococcus equorum]MDN5829773.1 hypothetical protein [Staphylococcus equorum]